MKTNKIQTILLWFFRAWWLLCVPFAIWVFAYNAYKLLALGRLGMPVNWSIVNMSVILMPLLFFATLIWMALTKDRSHLTIVDKIGFSLPAALSILAVIVAYFN